MKHAVWILGGIAAASFAACTYPDFQFRGDSAGSSEGSGGGAGAPATTGVSTGGGAQGGGGPTGSSTTGHMTTAESSSSTAETSSSTGASGSTVPCKTPPDDVTCMPGEVCCFHKMEAALDACGVAGACGGDFYEYSCNDPGDCPGAICCGTDANFNFLFEAIKCQPSCGSLVEYTMCDGPGDCTSPETCYQVPGYAAYGYCDL